jgi:ribosome-associated toxin RatA of RatAB toxin-antitoxin module
MTEGEAEQEAIIRGSPEVCFGAITDYESYPEWQPSIREVEVLARDRKGRGKEVRFVLDVLVKRVEYVLAYEYPKGWALRWSLLRGDMKRSDGSYRFEDLGDGTTRAVFQVAVDAGMWVPGPLLRKFNDVLMRGSVSALKKRVESLRS